jgi:hypothetical protein
MFALYLILLTLANLSHAQNYNISSAPFNLFVLSDDPVLDGDTLSACHTGVATESLCLSHSETGPYNPAVLYHNMTIDAIPNVRLLTVYLYSSSSFVRLLTNGPNIRNGEPKAS